MKIAQVAPLYEAVPPHRYGGTERVVAALDRRSRRPRTRRHVVRRRRVGYPGTPARGRPDTFANADDASGAARGGAAHPLADARRSVSRFRLRHHSFASRRLDDAVRRHVADPHGDDAARTTRSADGARGARHVSAGTPRVDQRRSAAASRRPRPRLGLPRCRTASSSTPTSTIHARMAANISPSSAGCAPRRDSTRRSTSLAAADGRCTSPPRSIRWTSSTSSA